MFSLRKEAPDPSTKTGAMISEYRNYVWRKYLFIIAMCVIAFVVGVYSLTLGGYETSFLDTLQTLFNHITGNVTDETADHFIWNLRLPRVLLGVLTGVGLAIVGSTMQSVLKNPLADPYTTGISSGASFGATLAIIVGFSFVGGDFAIIVNAFIFSLIPVGVILMLSKMRHASPTTMILSGIAVMYIFSSLTTFIQLRADPDDLKYVYTWGVGSLGYASWDMLPICFAFTSVGVAVMMIMAAMLNVLSSGDDTAKTLGLDASKFRIIGLLVASLTTAGLVSFTGPIGFVGLVAPHVARIFVGSDNRFLLPASAAFGTAMLLLADMLGRVIVAPGVLQVGVVMAFIGGPVFLWILMRQKSEVW